MRVLEILSEKKVEMCPKACCGVPVTECSCGPDCKHCDCYNKNKTMKETVTSASSIAMSMGGGNGFASGGIGSEPIKRVNSDKPKSKKKKKTKA